MKNTKGFTLIELMVVVAIIGILVTVGLPSYNAYVVDSNCKAAQGRLVSLEARMQRFYANSGRTYTNADTALGLPDTSGEEYDYSAVISAIGTRAGQAFVITATATGSQAAGAANIGCSTLTVSHTGAKTPANIW